MTLASTGGRGVVDLLLLYCCLVEPLLLGGLLVADETVPPTGVMSTNCESGFFRNIFWWWKRARENKQEREGGSLSAILSYRSCFRPSRDDFPISVSCIISPADMLYSKHINTFTAIIITTIVPTINTATPYQIPPQCDHDEDKSTTSLSWYNARRGPSRSAVGPELHSRHCSTTRSNK